MEEIYNKIRGIFQMQLGVLAFSAMVILSYLITLTNSHGILGMFVVFLLPFALIFLSAISVLYFVLFIPIFIYLLINLNKVSNLHKEVNELKASGQTLDPILLKKYYRLRLIIYMSDIAFMLTPLVIIKLAN